MNCLPEHLHLMCLGLSWRMWLLRMAELHVQTCHSRQRRVFGAARSWIRGYQSGCRYAFGELRYLMDLQGRIGRKARCCYFECHSHAAHLQHGWGWSLKHNELGKSLVSESALVNLFYMGQREENTSNTMPGS